MGVRMLGLEPHGGVRWDLGGGGAMTWRNRWILVLAGLVWSTAFTVHAGTEGDVRLKWTTCASDGIVQIFHAGKWGNICYEGFNDNTARITCHQLGYDNGALMSMTGKAGDFVWLPGVTCFGDKNALTDCLMPGTMWNASGECVEHKMAGVHCYNNGAKVDCAGDPQEVYGGVKIAKGSCNTEGQLLVYTQHRWGAVCSSTFSDADADVACRQMGFQVGWSHDVPSHQQISTRIYLRQIDCHGNETGLLNCDHTKGTYCGILTGHLAGVTCSNSKVRKSCDGTIIENTEGDIRLADGATNSEGRLEVFYHGHWGVVCAIQTLNLPGQWVCSRLGFDHSEHLQTVKHHGPNTMRLIYTGCRMEDAGCQPSVLSPTDPCPPIGLRCSNGSTPLVAGCETPECQLGAHCVVGEHGPYCACLPNVPPELCDRKLHSQCSVNLCENGGICTNTDSGAKCTCLSGYEGDICHIVSSSSILLPKWAVGCIAMVGLFGVLFIITGSWCFWRSRRLKHPHRRLVEEKEENFLAYHDDDENENL